MARAKPAARTVRLNADADAILIIDVINDLEFPGGEKVLPWAQRLVRPLRSVCRQARRSWLPVIYANDNCGFWRGSRDDVIRHCTRRGARGREVSAALRPHPRDYFILKPRHSAFFATPLWPLLDHLGVRRLVLAGMATNLCVVATAHDAAMHGYRVAVLSDCCAAESDFDHNVVLMQLKRFFHATICRSDQLVFPPESGARAGLRSNDGTDERRDRGPAGTVGRPAQGRRRQSLQGPGVSRRRRRAAGVSTKSQRAS